MKRNPKSLGLNREQALTAAPVAFPPVRTEKKEGKLYVTVEFVRPTGKGSSVRTSYASAPSVWMHTGRKYMPPATEKPPSAPSSGGLRKNIALMLPKPNST